MQTDAVPYEIYKYL